MSGSSAAAWPGTVTVALTGASGMPYGLRLIETLIASGQRVYLLYSQAAQVVARQELDLSLPARAAEAARSLAERYGARPGQLLGFGREEWFAPVASGSNPPDAMVVCPCSMGTLAAIAAGLSDNLIERAADVVLKEGRKLVLVPRETPLSTLHLENMLRLSRLGAVIVPPSPGFYHHPRSIEDLVDFVVARILDQLRISHALGPRWGEERLAAQLTGEVPLPPAGHGSGDGA
ncbi:MAG: UbiX family flavin prenyltransferase [Pseudomonadota bacterium]|nr:UbiX family flavin prenyltransferase [Pseudomonadota bacterium]